MFIHIYENFHFKLFGKDVKWLKRKKKQLKFTNCFLHANCLRHFIFVALFNSQNAYERVFMSYPYNQGTKAQRDYIEWPNSIR